MLSSRKILNSEKICAILKIQKGKPEAAHPIMNILSAL